MTKIPAILTKYESDLLSAWVSQQKAVAGPRGGAKPEAELRDQSRRFLQLFQQAAQSGNVSNTEAVEWKPVRDSLQEICRERATPAQCYNSGDA